MASFYSTFSSGDLELGNHAATWNCACSDWNDSAGNDMGSILSMVEFSNSSTVDCLYDLVLLLGAT